jgi:hypothetical protein
MSGDHVHMCISIPPKYALSEVRYGFSKLMLATFTDVVTVHPIELSNVQSQSAYYQASILGSQRIERSQ